MMDLPSSSSDILLATAHRHVQFALVVVLHLCSQANALTLNIHLPLKTNEWGSNCPYSEALESNLALIQNAESSNGKAAEQINFFSTHVPHVTLYLTDFDVDEVVNGTSVIDDKKVKSVLDSLRSISSAALHECDVGLLPSYRVAGPFAMWDAQLTDCLQILSNEIVDATSKFIRRPTHIPDWIWHLPEPERSRKLELIQRYGSPNVYDDFNPHVTVGFDTKTTASSRIDVMTNLGEKMPKPCAGRMRQIAVARIGIGGTVLQSGKIGNDIPLLPEGHSSALSA